MVCMSNGEMESSSETKVFLRIFFLLGICIVFGAVNRIPNSNFDIIFFNRNYFFVLHYVMVLICLLHIYWILKWFVKIYINVLKLNVNVFSTKYFIIKNKSITFWIENISSSPPPLNYATLHFFFVRDSQSLKFRPTMEESSGVVLVMLGNNNSIY